MIKSLFDYLNILQIEQYDPKRFLKWCITNFSKEMPKKRIPLVWTLKIKLIFLAFLVLNLIGLWIFGIIIFVLLLLNSFIYLWFIAFFLRIPQEVVIFLIKRRATKKIRSLKKNGLKVIGITGSYGKTTTKIYLQRLLSVKYRVLKTPDSYNTVLGIAKVIEKELSADFDFFICEMGAYKMGDIKELCEMVLPDYGLLTGITSQHLERFGSFENIVNTKFELFDYLGGQNVFLNGEDENIQKKI